METVLFHVSNMRARVITGDKFAVCKFEISNTVTDFDTGKKVPNTIEVVIHADSREVLAAAMNTLATDLMNAVQELDPAYREDR